MVALPLPQALATPPFCEPEVGAALLFVVTGKTFGADVIHWVWAEFVRSRTYGGVANVPIARNCPADCKFPTVIELGMIVSERRSCGAAVRVVANVAVFDTTDPSLLVSTAVMVLLPAAKFLATPIALIEPAEGRLEVHFSCGELVTSCCRPVVPEVARAMNCAVSFRVESVWALGRIVTAVNCWVVPPVTVNAAVPVTTVAPAL
jgi:hypothetical protein